MGSDQKNTAGSNGPKVDGHLLYEPGNQPTFCCNHLGLQRAGVAYTHVLWYQSTKGTVVSALRVTTWAAQPRMPGMMRVPLSSSPIQINEPC